MEELHSMYGDDVCEHGPHASSTLYANLPFLNSKTPYLVLFKLTQTLALNVIGSAAFFAPLVSIMLPPYMALSTYLFALATLAMGMLIGWAWGCAAMAAALRARSQVLLASQVDRATAG